MSLRGLKVAVTGATGFVGRHAVAALAAAGCNVRLLARSEPAHALWRDASPEVVLGSLEDPAALQRLVENADAVLHLAGAIKARNTEGFMRINRDGTAALVAALRRRAPGAHLLHVSSLAAGEPTLSGYCASKRAGEDAVLQELGSQPLSILRPPAIYGPGDRETLAFFQLARLHWVPLLGRPSARLAVIHVEDAVSALLARLAAGPSGKVQGIADGERGGYSWQQILAAAAAAVGNREPRFVQLPRPLLQGAGSAAGLLAQLAGQAAMFNPGKLRELLHEDWSAPAATLYIPAEPARYGLAEGFAMTANWYLHHGWLKPSR